MTDLPPPLAFIGGGNMASAIIAGASSAGVLDKARCVVADPDPAKRSSFTNAVATAAEAVNWLRHTETASNPGQIVLAVKPQLLETVAGELAGPLTADPFERVVISILAGVPSAKVRRLLGSGRVIRVMPNTPAQVGRGMTAISLGAGAGPGDESRAQEVFAACGQTIGIDESLMDAFTGLAGSGPAYVFYLAEAMIDAAVSMGFDHDQATQIARQTIAGSGELLARSRQQPNELRAAVTSKGGTTAAAIEVLDQLGVHTAVGRAILAARDRGAQLADE